MKKTKDSFMFFNFCEDLGEKIKKRKKIGTKKKLLKTDVVFFFFFSFKCWHSHTNHSNLDTLAFNLIL